MVVAAKRGVPFDLERAYPRDVHVRPATAADHPTFVRLFAELAVDDPVPDVSRFAVEVVPTTIMLEDDGGRVLGYSHYRFVGESLHVSHIVSAPEARRRGVGLALLDALARIAERAGATTWRLNVKRDNAAAIALYERMGMTRAHESLSLRIDWSHAKAIEGVTSRSIEPTDDERVERAMRLVPRQLATIRATTTRILLLLEEHGDVVGAASFDALFPGGSPFRVARPELALALLAAMKPFARGEHAYVNVNIEDQPDVAAFLRAHGATVRLDMFHMVGIPPHGSTQGARTPERTTI